MIPTTPSMSSSSVQSSAQNSVMDRVRAKLTRFSDLLSWRLSEATEEFRFVLESGRPTAMTPMAFKTAVPMREATLAGFLVSPEQSTLIPLYEGSNYFGVKENARVKRLVDEAAGLDFDFDIKIGRDDIRLVSSKPTLTTRSIDSNDSLTLGKETYFLKLLPQEYRTTHPIRDEEGDYHVI